MYSLRMDGDTRKLLRQMKHLSNLDKRGIHAAMAEALHSSTIDRFKEGKAPDGKRWPISTRAATEGGKTLVKTARLRNSIRTKADATGFAIGTNVVYAGTHQKGVNGRTIRAKTAKGLRFKIGGRWVNVKKVTITIPARPFLGISEDDQRELKGTLEDALQPD